jgi:hypothetical protein
MANKTNRRPDLDNDALAAAVQSGKTLEQVAQQYKCTPATVRNRILRMGVLLPPVGTTKGYPLKYGADKQGKVKAWRKRNPERTQMMYHAHYAIRMALRRGDLVRPERCENDCGSTVSPQAAHYDYSRPLDVRWLCPPCHVVWDHDEPKTI